MTKISDRVDILESESNDGIEETKSVGAVNIDFTGKLTFGQRLGFLKCPFQAYLIYFNLEDMEIVDNPMITQVKK